MALRWEDMLLGAEPRPSLVFRRWRSPLRGWHCYFRRCESQSLWCGHCRKNMKKLVHVADVAWKIRTLVAPCWCMFGGQRLVNANPHVDFPQVNDNWTSCRRVMTSFLKVDPLSERSGIPDTFFCPPSNSQRCCLGRALSVLVCHCNAWPPWKSPSFPTHFSPRTKAFSFNLHATLTWNLSLFGAVLRDPQQCFGSVTFLERDEGIWVTCAAGFGFTCAPHLWTHSHFYRTQSAVLF